jgi:hypothetical protein
MYRLTILLALTGCTSLNPAIPLDPGGTSGLTYFQDTAPIIATRCGGCHDEGGVAPFPLTTYEEVSAKATWIRQVVADRLMPPLPPDQSNGCPKIDDLRNMEDAERQKLLDWVDGGAPAGDASRAAAIPPRPDKLGTPTRVVDSGIDYLSAFAGSDDYRCFIIDPKISERFDLIAADTTSTNRAIVHHVIISWLPPQSVAAAQAADAADPGPGYTCFGGPGVAGAVPITASAVGAQTLPFPEGTGAPLPAGSQFIVQVHYNFDNGRAANRIALRLWKSATPITRYPHAAAIGNNTFTIPPGAALEVSGTTAFDGTTTKPGKIWSVFPHMHQLGTSIYVELQRKDGSTQCLMNVPRWDFHWQGSYQFMQPVLAQVGDRLKVTCNWDNSPQNQPIVNGVQQPPREVRFGEGSTDEMCLTGVTLTD